MMHFLIVSKSRQVEILSCVLFLLLIQAFTGTLITVSTTPQDQYVDTKAGLVLPFSSATVALGSENNSFQRNLQPPLWYNVDSRYDWKLSTEENYKVECSHLYGPFKAIRERLDYSFHACYSRERQELQDRIVQILLQTHYQENTKNTRCDPTSSDSPWAIFTAGVMGAGKSFIIRQLHEAGLFPLQAFVIVDPDEIRRLLPEFIVYVGKNAQHAGTLTRKEAGMLSEMLSLAALERGHNVLVDGSLRDHQWYEIYFSELRYSFPGIQLAIFHVTAPIDIIQGRVKARAGETGRLIPQQVLEQAIAEVPASVNRLKHLVDFFLKIDNSFQQGGEADILAAARVSLASMTDRLQARCNPKSQSSRGL